MRTFLIGLDGATYTVLDHLVAEGVMPNLARIYRDGVRSELTSTPVPIKTSAPLAETSAETVNSVNLNVPSPTSSGVFSSMPSI